MTLKVFRASHVAALALPFVALTAAQQSDDTEPAHCGAQGRAAASAPWPMSGHDACHTSASSVIAPAMGEFTLAWSITFQFEGGIGADISVGAGDTLFLGTGSGLVHAIDGMTGAVKWNFTAGNEVDSAVTVGTNGLVYVASVDERVHALNAVTGEEVWSAHLQAALYESPVLSGSTLYIAVGRRMVALTANSGAYLWERWAAVDRAFHRPALAGDMLYASTTDGAVYALNASDGGMFVWTQEALVTYGSVGSPVSVDAARGRVFLVVVGKDSPRQTLNCLDAVTGNVVWSDSSAFYDEAPPAIGSDGTVYIGGSSAVVAIRGSDGTVLWKSDFLRDSACTPTLDAGGMLFAAMHWTYALYALDTSTGAVVWSWPSIDRGGFTQPALGASGALYIAGNDGRVLAFSGDSGAGNRPPPRAGA